MRFLWETALPSLCLVISLGGPGCAAPRTARHGTITDLSLSKTTNLTFCPHKVPQEVCTRCNPALAPRFQAAGDWCAEHAVPESQCLLCHPDLSFAPLPSLPEGADFKLLSKRGEDVPSLATHAVRGKVTLFDFYADWCAPCRKVDAHVYNLLQRRGDIAYRKLNMVNWDSPLAKRHLAGIASLPYLLVFKPDGTLGRAVVGFDLAALDRAIQEASGR